MSVADWLNTFLERVEGDGFRLAEAGAVAHYMRLYGVSSGSLIESRRREDHEIIILDLFTGAPQRPMYPILRTERLGLLFAGPNTAPLVTVLRDDFPDTEHQHLVPQGFPATLCIDDRPWGEARLTWTPAELIERILSWFRRAGRGELHDARQPLDPLLMGSPLSFFIERVVLEADPGDLIAEHDPASRNLLRVTSARGRGFTPNAEPFSIVSYRVPPHKMKRLRWAPDNFLGLCAALRERGIDLQGDLGRRIGEWFAQGALWRLLGRFAVIVEMPIVSPRGEQLDGLDHRAFVTACHAGEIAVALGIAQKAPEGVGRVGYARLIGEKPAIDEAALAAMPVQAAEVHLAFDADLGARLAGRSVRDARKAVLVGAGAIGSHLADGLAREGRFTWVIIDDDRMLPHNAARHIAGNAQVPHFKAPILATHLNATVSGPPCARAIVANVLPTRAEAATVNQALDEAEVIIDASASILAARHLSDHPTRARRFSAFFNPAGEAAVLLAEPADRAVSLRDLEAQYLGLVLRSPHLEGHLGKAPETVAYTGACRAITNRIPQSRAVVLSGLTAMGFSRAVDGEAGVIAIWTLANDGSVTADTAAPEPVAVFEVMGWQITIDKGLVRLVYAMREAQLPDETGGVLFGLVDIPARRVHLVDASAAPPDSQQRPGGFVRGVRGVEELMDNVRRRSAGQVRYVGEWHSHPPRSSARPSAIDGEQIDWLAALLRMDSMPALMFIAADREFSVIFVGQHAAPVSRRDAA
jgi:hypothetical protein